MTKIIKQLRDKYHIQIEKKKYFKDNLHFKKADFDKKKKNHFEKILMK